MRYIVTLTPLEPFLFGGDNTFGKLQSDKEKKEGKEEGTYLVKSRYFPQQSAVLGMLKKEIMTQSGVLTRKVRGEWVDDKKKNEAKDLVGDTKFDITSKIVQNFGNIKTISPIFLLNKENERYIKKVDIDSYKFENGLLEGYKQKIDIYDNFISLDMGKKLSSGDIFKPVEEIGNKKGGGDNSLFKKTSYKLLKDFKFAFYLECEYRLNSSVISLGADGSKFKMSIKEDDSTLNYIDNNGYLTLLSDSYITVPLKDNCTFAITSEISYQNLIGKKGVQKSKFTDKNNFAKNGKSDKIYLYEKGSVIIGANQKLIDNLNNANLQQIGYNTYTYQGE